MDSSHNLCFGNGSFRLIIVLDQRGFRSRQTKKSQAMGVDFDIGSYQRQGTCGDADSIDKYIQLRRKQALLAVCLVDDCTNTNRLSYRTSKVERNPNLVASARVLVL